MKRPGMRAMLAYMEAQKGKNYVVIFDDLKRFARDTRFHLELRSELASRGATPECLNFKFEDSPEGKFIETMMAATGQLEREQNRRQVKQKMMARVEAGYWVFRAPVGYKHVQAKGGGGKVLVPNEPLSSVVREALEGYASGRFASQAEVQRFLESNPHFPKDTKDGRIRPMTITRLLKKVVYAGYVEAPKWGVSVRKGQHDALISFETHQRIIDNIEGKKRAPAARKDYNVDFPLRGFVACKCCGNAMTGAWSKGCRKHYAYYRCETRGCDAKSKSVPRAKLEAGFEEIMQRMAPSRGLIEIAGMMFQDAWALKEQTMREERAAWKSQIKTIDSEIENTLDKIIEAENKSVIRAFEKRIEKLERQKIVLSEKVSGVLPDRHTKSECMELSLSFLSNPWKVYKNGGHAAKQTVLRLAFQEPLTYCPKEAYGTPKFSFPFKVLGEITRAKKEMVL
ncbi:recombinase family protein [Seohaeicola saemankumensis]|nr:recombinase family protein [Seohaeicola saemankumensis]